MVIDARNLGSKEAAPYDFLKNVTQRDVQLLRQMQKKSELPPPTDEELEMALTDGEKARKTRADSLELSAQGRQGLLELDVKFGYVYDTDYDKERAVKNAWANSQNSMFRYIGNSGRVSDEAVVGMSCDEFGEYMKTHELDRDIDWNAVEQLTDGFHKFSDRDSYYNYAAALYTSLEDRIKTDFSGDEQKAELEKLSSILDRSVNEVADSLKGGGPHCSIDTFGILGIDLPEGKIEDSIRATVESKISAYRDYIAQNKDYAGIKDTEDKWLARDVGYMANALRNAYRAETPTDSPDGLWSDNDLACLMLLGTSCNDAQYDSMMAVAGYNDEERLGMSLAVQWLKGEALMEAYNVGDDVRALGEQIFAKYAEKLAGNKDSFMTKLREYPLTEDPSKYLAIDKDAINAVVDVMKKSYAESGDAVKALCDTAKFARYEYLKKVGNSTAARYGENSSGANFWRRLYEVGMRDVVKTYGDFASAVQNKKEDEIRRNIGGYMLSALQGKPLNRV